jgi:hypothetical protein
MNKNAINTSCRKMNRLLGMKYWFGGKMVYPWEHPLNKIPNCVAITLDGCVTHKFQLHKNGKLRVRYINESGGFLRLGLKPLQTITTDELYTLVAKGNNDYAGAFMQLTSPVPIPVDMAELREIEILRRRALQLL